MCWLGAAGFWGATAVGARGLQDRAKGAQVPGHASAFRICKQLPPACMRGLCAASRAAAHFVGKID